MTLTPLICKGRPEHKFIFDDGREAVYDGDSGVLTTDPDIAGTYNFINPDVGKPWYTPRNIGHGILDVVPFCIGGNDRFGAGPSCF